MILARAEEGTASAVSEQPRKPLKRFTPATRVVSTPLKRGANERILSNCVTSGTIASPPADAAERARLVRERLPAEGLFADHDWRTSPVPFPLGPALAKEVESLGRVLLQFYRAVNLLYRKSVEGKQPEWVARWLDQGKPAELIALQRSPALKNEVPRVIRPDLLMTEHGLSVTELDSVPGGIGLTGWLNQTYSQMGAEVLGGADGMLRGFASIFGDAPTVHIVVSEEAATYRPEMAGWPASWAFAVQGPGCEVQRVRRRGCGLSLLRVVRPGQRAERESDPRPGGGQANPPDPAAQADL